MKTHFFAITLVLATEGVGASAIELGKTGTLDQGKISYKTKDEAKSTRVDFVFKEPIEPAESTILTTLFMAKTCKGKLYVLDSNSATGVVVRVRRSTLKFHCRKPDGKASENSFAQILCDEPEAQKNYLIDLCKGI